MSKKGFYKKKDYTNGTFTTQDFKNLSIFYITMYRRAYFPKQDLNIIPVKYGHVEYTPSNNYNHIYCFKDKKGYVEEILRKSRYINNGDDAKTVKEIHDLFVRNHSFQDSKITTTIMTNHLDKKIEGLKNKTNLNYVMNSIKGFYESINYTNSQKKYLLKMYTFASKNFDYYQK
jgi:hypothetical protein